MLWNVDLWSEMNRLRREMNGLFNGVGRAGDSTTFPFVNLYDGKDAVVVTAELPGMTKEKVSITFSDGILTLAGDRDPLPQIKNMAVVRQERAQGKFEKSLRLPVKIAQDRISASFTNGIVTVTLPKAEEAKPKTIAIQTN